MFRPFKISSNSAFSFFFMATKWSSSRRFFSFSLANLFNPSSRAWLSLSTFRIFSLSVLIWPDPNSFSLSLLFELTSDLSSFPFLLSFFNSSKALLRESISAFEASSSASLSILFSVLRFRWSFKASKGILSSRNEDSDDLSLKLLVSRPCSSNVFMCLIPEETVFSSRERELSETSSRLSETTDSISFCFISLVA